MTATSSPCVAEVRVAPAAGICRQELRVLRELMEYVGDRDVPGTTLLDAAVLGRQAYLWTLSDGEHVLLLMQRQRFCHWQATRRPLAELHACALDWLTEPSLERSFGERDRLTRR